MVNVKPGVEFTVIAPGGYMILQAIKDASKSLKLDLTITSGTDGVHSGPLDPHHTGEAYDIRSHDFDPQTKAQVLNAIMGDLEMGRFYGFLEGMGGADEHIHVQRARSTVFTAEDLLNS